MLLFPLGVATPIVNVPAEAAPESARVAVTVSFGTPLVAVKPLTVTPAAGGPPRFKAVAVASRVPVRVIETLLGRVPDVGFTLAM